MSSKLSIWHEELALDPDKDFLLNGIEHGFRITDPDAQFSQVERDNYSSATNPYTHEAVENQIRRELSEGNYVMSHAKPHIVSSLGAIIKPSSAPSLNPIARQKVRLIHDASQPVGQALNDFVTTEKFQYQTFDEAIKLLTPNCYIAKVDLSNAYRSVKIHPTCYPATGLKWTFNGHTKPTYLTDTRLPFGSSKSPHIFHRITQSVRRMMARRGIHGLVVYLDDFCIICDSFEDCKRALNILISLLRRLGFQISWSKVEGPSRCLTFLGITIDTQSMTLSLPEEKLASVGALLAEFMQRRRASRRQIQSLAGKLNWCCQVIPAGRPYLRRILATMLPLRRPTHKVKLSNAFFADIAWWQCFLRVFNGTLSCMPPMRTYTLQVDSSNTGGGLYMEGDWAYVNWQRDMPHVAPLHINSKETIAVCLAAQRWAQYWSNSVINIYTDSTTARSAITKGNSRHPVVLHFLRQLHLTAALFQIKFNVFHIPGTRNTIPDTISRIAAPKYLSQLHTLLRPQDRRPDFFWTTMCHHMSYPTFLFLLPQIQRLSIKNNA